MRRKNLLVLSLVIILSLLVCKNVKASDVRGVTDKSIKIGLIGDHTGPASSVAMPAIKAIKNYIKYINESGGVHGRKLKIIEEDTRYSIPAAISAYKKLVYKDAIFAMQSVATGSSVNVIWKSVQKDKLPFVSIAMNDVTVKPYKRYIFIVSDVYSGQAKTLVDYIVNDLKLKKPRIGLVHPDSEAGKVDRKAVLERLKMYKMKPASIEILNTGSFDASSQVMSLKRAKVNCLLTVGYVPQPVVVLLRDMRKFGLKAPVFGSFGTCSEETIQGAGEAAKEFYAVSAMASWYDEGHGVAKMREITLKYHPGTEKPYRGKLYTQGWVDALVMIEGLKRTGRELNTEALIDAMETIKNFDTGGLCGHITYSSTSHKGGNTWKIFKADIASGKLIPLTGWRVPK